MTNPTNDLIASLAQQGVDSRDSNPLRFVLPMLGALALCAFAISMVLEDAFTPYQMVGFSSLAAKWGFSITLVVVAPLALWILGKPGRDARWMLLGLAVPFAVFGTLFVGDMMVDVQPFPGKAWQNCLTAMLTLSPLAFGGAVIAMRHLAPTNLQQAGLVAGVFGGGVAMTAYAPFCMGSGTLYMAVFYCLPILTMAVVGYVLGPRLLRW